MRLLQNMRLNAIKIGYTVQGAEQRVKQWQKYYSDAKLIGWWTATQLDNAMHKVFFMDFLMFMRVHVVMVILI